MELHELHTDDRAVSPVVGVALLIAITVILAAVIGVVVLGLGTGGVDTPQAQLQAEWDDTAAEITITHNGGEPLPANQITFVGGAGDEVVLANELTAGNSEVLAYASFTDETEITVIWDDPNSDSTTVLTSFEK